MPTNGTNLSCICDDFTHVWSLPTTWGLSRSSRPQVSATVSSRLRFTSSNVTETQQSQHFYTSHNHDQQVCTYANWKCFKSFSNFNTHHVRQDQKTAKTMIMSIIPASLWCFMSNESKGMDYYVRDSLYFTFEFSFISPLSREVAVSNTRIYSEATGWIYSNASPCPPCELGWYDGCVCVDKWCPGLI